MGGDLGEVTFGKRWASLRGPGADQPKCHSAKLRSRPEAELKLAGRIQQGAAPPKPASEQSAGSMEAIRKNNFETILNDFGSP